MPGRSGASGALYSAPVSDAAQTHREHTDPYLSVVVTARNDDHGGNLLPRMQTFVNGLLAQCSRHRLPAELIIVEWNPPTDRPPLAQALRWPAEPGFCQVRVLEVPLELHRRFPHWQALPLYQMIAKNAGIRRARGEFILATNIDILFSDEIMQFVAARRLERGKMYRVDRWDVMADVPVDACVEEQLAYCKSHLLRVNAREGTFGLSADGQRVLEPNDIAAPNVELSLGTGWFPREFSGEEPFRWVDNDAELLLQPAAALERALVLDVEPGPGVNMGPFLLEARDETGASVSSVWVKRRSVVTLALLVSGDGPLRLRLHAKGGGNKIATDPRTLNFRVFRCQMEEVSRVSTAVTALQEKSSTVRHRQTLAARAARGLRLLLGLFRDGSDVQFRVPLSPRRLASLQLRQDEGGVSFSAEPFRGLLRRGRQPPTDDEILDSHVRVMWGGGWHGAERAAGETFRWSSHESALVVFSPGNTTAALSLTVEGGPAIGFQPFDLEVRDQWGSMLATVPVRGRTEVEVPAPRTAGAFVISLHARGGGPPKKAPGDSRVLVFRVFRVRWTVPIEDPSSFPAPFEVGFSGSGIWCTGGWTESVDSSGSRSLGLHREAELLVRIPEGSPRTLMLALESGPAARGAPVDVTVQDPRDRVLYRGTVRGIQTVHIPDALSGGNFYVLRLRRAGGRDDQHSDQPSILLSKVTCTGESSGELLQTSVEPVMGIKSEAAPVHLHTNGCGDFTLLAREHWFDLRGYPEFDLFSMNIDSVFCWTAHHGGAREEILADPMRIYHIEHGSGSGWTPEGQEKLFQRIAAKGLSWLDYQEVLHWARIMSRFDAPMIFNHEDWGMAAEQLRESGPWIASRAELVIPPC